MNELAGLFGGGGGGGGIADPSSATSQSSPFLNTNSGIFFGSTVGATTADTGATASDGRAAQGGYNPQPVGVSIPAVSALAPTGGLFSSPLLIGALVVGVLAIFGWFVFKR